MGECNRPTAERSESTTHPDRPTLPAPEAFQAVCDLDLEGIVAKRMTDAYEPEQTKWWKVLNRGYSQKEGRAELFERRYA